MAEDKSGRCGAGAAGGAMVGPLWFFGWLFTIAFAKLTLLESLLGLIIWPYYLGIVLRG